MVMTEARLGWKLYPSYKWCMLNHSLKCYPPLHPFPSPSPPTVKGRQEIASFALEETDDISDFLNKDVYSKIEHVENGSVSMVEIPFNGEMINRLLLKFLKGNLGALE